MNRILQILTVSIAATLLPACSKEPTEIQKAQLEPKLIGCSLSVNPSTLDDQNPLTLLSMMGKISEFSGKKWTLSDDESTITATFRSEETVFECEFSLDTESEWKIEKVRRNGEEVYDRVTATAKLNELRAEKEAQLEAERIEREIVKEEKRLAKITNWHERGYSNVLYKYYQKLPTSWNDSLWQSPELRIVCDPAYPRFQFDDSQVRMMGRADVEFTFYDEKGRATTAHINLTSSGDAGVPYQSFMGEDVKSTKESNASAINMMKAASRIEVGGAAFMMDDLSQIPCI